MAQIFIKDEDFVPLKGKVVLITGASSGIGLATARLLISQGAYVMSGDMNDSPLEHPNHTFQKTNVTIWSELRALFQLAKDKHGRIDHVFSNAGISGRESYMEDKYDASGQLLEPDSSVYDINMRGMINTSYLGLHHMRKQSPPGGSIVCTGSASSFQRFAMCDYTTTKHGVLGWMRGIVANLEADDSPIRVNCVGPSWTITGFLSQEICDTVGVESQSADAVARNVAYLMADESRQGEFHYLAGGRSYEIEKNNLLPAATAAVGLENVNVEEGLAKLRLMTQKANAHNNGPAAATNA